MKHYGDITKISGYDLPIVDIITGGSPCQDLSVAGKRAGLSGERSGLFMEQVRIVKEMRERDRNENGRTGFSIRPRYMVWENVTGALSSGDPKGADFQAVLTEIARISEPECPDVPLPKKWGGSGCIYDDLGRWSIAWRVHDAQYWGVPQRRKRIALVADFGGLSAPEILFERKGMHWDSPESRETRETAPRSTERSSGETGINGETAGTLDASYFKGCGERHGVERDVVVGKTESFTLKVRGGCEIDSHGKRAGKGALIQKERSGTLGVSQDQTLIQISSDTKKSTCYGISAYESNAMKSQNPNSGVYVADTARTLDLNGGSPACNQGGIAVLERKCLNPWDVQSKHIQPEEGIAETLYSGECRHGGGESYVMVLNDQGGQMMDVSEDKTSTLRAQNHGHLPVVLDEIEVEEKSDSTRTQSE